MASPVVTAPPRRRRSFAGPVVLIILGVVFLLANIGVLTGKSLFLWYAHYWPVLIIIWGAIKLVEYYQAQREGTSYGGIGAGGVLLLVLIILTGGVCSRLASVNWQALQESGDFGDWSGFGFWGTPFDFTVTQQQAFPAGGTLSIVSERGDVTVRPSSDDQVHLTATERVYANNQNDAKQISEQYKPTITSDGKTVTVHAGMMGKVVADLQVLVPDKAPIDISTRHGDVSVIDRQGNVTVTSDHGDVHVENIGGDATVRMRHGDLVARTIGGNAEVDGRVSDVTASDIKGFVALNGDFYGDLSLNNVAKGVRFNSSRTNLDTGKLDGQLTMDSGDLRASSLAGPLRLSTRSKDIRIDEFTGDAQIDDSNGEVELHINKAPLGNITVNNHRGRVFLAVPSNAGFQVNAHTTRGDIETDFGMNTQGSSGSETVLNGTNGNGTAKLQLTNERGDIELRKSD